MPMMANSIIHPNGPLSVSPTSLTIEKGASGTATVSGGEAPIVVSSDKTSITPTLSNGTLTISVDAGSTANSGTITITDDNGNGESVEVEVTVAS